MIKKFYGSMDAKVTWQKAAVGVYPNQTATSSHRHNIFAFKTSILYLFVSS
jgi:hypothetical protein